MITKHEDPQAIIADILRAHTRTFTSVQGSIRALLETAQTLQEINNIQSERIKLVHSMMDIYKKWLVVLSVGTISSLLLVALAFFILGGK